MHTQNAELVIFKEGTYSYHCTLKGLILWFPQTEDKISNSLVSLMKNLFHSNL
jgi:hypothetical protein